MAAEMFEREYGHFLGQVYAGEGKCRVECEAVLPDYKEAAHRVLRVDTKTRVNSKNTYLQGQNIICEVEGVATFHVLYLADRAGEPGTPAAHLAQENFSYTFKVPFQEENLDPEGILALVEVHPENTSFKLLGPRKLSMRSEVVLSLDLKCNREFAYYSQNLPADVKTLQKSVTVASLQTTHQEDLTFSETICLPDGYLPIGEICQMDVDLFCLGVRTVAGGVILSGSCDIHCSYVAEDETFVSFYQPIEFEKNIGVPLCGEDSLCSVQLTPNFLKANTDVNEEGENKNIFFEIGCTAELFFFVNQEVALVEDAFSTDCRLVSETMEKECEEILSLAPFSVTQRCELELEEKGLVRAEGVRSILEWKDSYIEEGKIALEGKATFRYLGVKEDGGFQNCENSHEFKVLIPCESPFAENGECRIEICGGVRGAQPSPNSDRLFVNYDLAGFVTIYRKNRFVSVFSLSKGEELEKEGAALLFCYPEKGERVWDICKKYHVSPEKFCQTNGIVDEVLPPSVRIEL